MSIAMNTHLKRGLETKEIPGEFKAGIVIYRSNRIGIYPSEEEIADALESIMSKRKVKEAIDILVDWKIAEYGLRENEYLIKEYEINPEVLPQFEALDRIANSMSIKKD